MEELLTCWFCSKRYDLELRRPKVLDCGHTFCLDCLERHDHANGRFCPKDGKEFKDPPRLVRDCHDRISYLDTLQAEEAVNKKSVASRLWCTQCALPASPQCEAEHRTCKIDSVEAQKMQAAKNAVRRQFQRVSSLVERYINLLRGVRDVMSKVLIPRLQQDMAHFEATKQLCLRAAEKAETLPGSALEGGEGAAELQNLMSESVKRKRILVERGLQLKLLPSVVGVRPETVPLKIVSRYLERFIEESEQKSASPGHSAQSSAPQPEAGPTGASTQRTSLTPSSLENLARKRKK